MRTEYEEGITKAIINPTQLQKWMHQNGAEIIDMREGVLLDSYIISCKNGIARICETYVNPNESTYYMEFTRTREHDIWNRWEKFTEDYDAEMEAEEKRYAVELADRYTKENPDDMYIISCVLGLMERGTLNPEEAAMYIERIHNEGTEQK